MNNLKTINEEAVPAQHTLEAEALDYEAIAHNIEINGGSSEEIMARAKWLLVAIDNLGVSTQIEFKDGQVPSIGGEIRNPEQGFEAKEISQYDDPLAMSLNPLRLFQRYKEHEKRTNGLSRLAADFVGGEAGLGDLVNELNGLNGVSGNMIGVKVDESQKQKEFLKDDLIELAGLCATTVLNRGHKTFIGDADYSSSDGSATYAAKQLTETLSAYRSVLAFSRHLPEDVPFRTPRLMTSYYGIEGADRIVNRAIEQIMSPPSFGYGIETWLFEKAPPKEGTARYDLAQKFKRNHAVDAVEALKQVEDLAVQLGVDGQTFIAQHALLIAGELSVVHENYGETLDSLLATTDDIGQNKAILLKAHEALIDEKRSIGIDSNKLAGRFGGYHAMQEMESVGASRLVERQLHIAARFKELGDDEGYKDIAETIAKDILDEVEILGADLDAPMLTIAEVLAIQEFAEVLPTELRISLISNAIHKLEPSAMASDNPQEAVLRQLRQVHSERIVTFDDNGHLSQDTIMTLQHMEDLIDESEDVEAKQLMAFLFADYLVYIAQTGINIEQFSAVPLVAKNVSEITEFVFKVAEDQKKMFKTIRENEHEAVQKVREYVEESDGVDPADIDAEVERIKNTIGVSINIGTEALTEVLFNAKGNSYNSSWDTGYRGALYALLRDMVEEQMSVRLKSRLLAASQVVYGAVLSDNGKDSVVGAAPGGYGDAWITLKPDVYERTVITPQDSFFGPTRGLRGTLGVAGPVFAAVNNIQNGKYTEAQIVGGVTAGDIAEIHIPEQGATPEMINAIKVLYPDVKVALINSKQASKALRSRKLSVVREE